MGDSSGSSLRDKTIAGLGWRSLTTGGRILLRFGIGVILARILGPEAFGLIGLATIVIGFGDLFVDIGLGPAIVQRKILTERHIRVGFTLSIIGGLLLSLITYSVAPVAARLLGDRALTPIIEWLALTFLFSGCEVVARSLLERRLNFRAILAVDLGSYVIGYGGLGITMALLGYGVWSLVGASLIQAGFGAAIAYFLSSHSLQLLFSWQETRDLARFGSGITLERVVNYFALKGDYFVIGRVLGANSLGLYTRAYNLMTAPLSHFVKVIVDVLFPALSKIQDKPDRMHRVFQEAITTVTFFVLPLVGTTILFAPEIVIGVYGEKWAGAVVPLQILGVAGLYRALYNAAAAFVKAHGEVFKLAGCQTIYAITTVGGAWIGARHYGIEGAAVAVACSIIIMYLMIMALAQRVTETTTWENVKNHTPGVLFAVPVISGAYIGKLWGPHLNSGQIVEAVLGFALSIIISVTLVGIIPARWIDPVPKLILEASDNYLSERKQRTLSWWVGKSTDVSKKVSQ